MWRHDLLDLGRWSSSGSTIGLKLTMQMGLAHYGSWGAIKFLDRGSGLLSVLQAETTFAFSEAEL
jgi:hypothetical protein